MMQNSAIEPVKKAVFVDQQRTATPNPRHESVNFSCDFPIEPDQGGKISSPAFTAP
jgi:hypothetical protein